MTYDPVTIASPFILALGLPLVAYAVWRSRRIVGQIARWTMRGAMVALLLAAAGLEVQCDRDARIIVMVDVSPSTRTATFRDPRAVEKRLKPLLRSRAYETVYFADGIQSSPQESPAGQTRLESPVADAVILLSDGRFDPPATLPPTFPVIDPALDTPADAQVSHIEQRGDQCAVVTRVNGPTRRLHIDDASPSQLDIAPGDRVTLARPHGRSLTARLDPDPADAWPENDALRTLLPPPTAMEQWAVGLSLNGFRAIATDALPTDSADYLLPDVIALATNQPLDPRSADRLTQYVRDLGGTLVLVGPASGVTEPLRSIAPLLATPPAPQQQWVVLLDASGSMESPTPDGRSRWQAAVEAARRLVRQLPARANVSLATFNRSTTWHARGQSPAQIDARLDALAAVVPTGPTGLASALQAIATADFSEARLLLITDGDVALADRHELAGQIAAHRVQLLALLTGEADASNKALSDLATQTGGAVIHERRPGAWIEAVTQLARHGLGESRSAVTGTARGSGEIAGFDVRYTAVYTAWARPEAEVIARGPEDRPLIATMQAGSGRVVSVAGEISPADLTAVAMRLRQPPTDPRFATRWDEQRDRVILTARDRRGPMNELRPVLVRDGSDPVMFEQTAPGEYTALLSRRPEATVATVRVSGQIVARHAIAGRYPKEFDAIGNDRRALRTLAERTGGRVIDVGDHQPITFPGATEWRSTRATLSAIGCVLLMAAIVLLRAPYLEDRFFHALAARRRR